MKGILKTMAITAALAASVVTPTFAAGGVADMQPSEITVHGSASRSVAPTYALLTLGITTSDANVTVAKSANDRVMSQLVSNLSNLGVAKKDITTSTLNINPDYNYDNNKRSVTGYTISNTVTVKINDLNKVSTIIGSAVSAGANEVNSLSFKNDISDTLSDTLTAESIKNGRHQAEVMASALGRSLGPVKTASIDAPVTRTYADNGLRFMKVGASALSSNTPVEEGSLIVSKDTNITYYLQ